MILDLRSPNFRNDGWIEDWRIYKNIQKYTPFLWPSDEKLENLRLHIWGNPLLLHQCLPWSLSSQASMSDGRVCPVVLRDHKDRKVEWLQQSDPKHCLSCATSGPSKIARFTALQTAEHQFCTCQRARARAVAAHWPWKTPAPASKDWWFKTDVVVTSQNIRSSFTWSSINRHGYPWRHLLKGSFVLIPYIFWAVGLVLFIEAWVHFLREAIFVTTQQISTKQSATQPSPSVLFCWWNKGLQGFLQRILMLWGHCKSLDDFNNLRHQWTLVQSHVKVCFCLISLDEYSQQLGASSKLLLALAATPNKSAAEFINWSHLDVLHRSSQVIPSSMVITVRTITSPE